MNIEEIADYSPEDKFHSHLNPVLWAKSEHLHPDVQKALTEIANDFLEFMGIQDPDVYDITVTGSNAAFTYTDSSDLDLRIIIGKSEKEQDSEIYLELFDAKKILYNLTNDISIHGIPVEIYVQFDDQPTKTTGEYSIIHKEWIHIPTKVKAKPDHTVVKQKYDRLGKIIDMALGSKNEEAVRNCLKLIKRYRQAGLEKAGENSPENLAFKAIRSTGVIQELRDKLAELKSVRLSVVEEDGLDEARNYKPVVDPTIWWHGSPTGDLRGGTTGLHLGTQRAAEEALTARIGYPVNGHWDGTREYGKTKLMGKETLKKRGIFPTGYNCHVPDHDFYPTEIRAPSVGNNVPVSMTAKPILAAFKLIGPMTNSKMTAYPDYKANGYMKASLKRGNPRSGFYYENEAEDYGSISVVVPNGSFVERVSDSAYDPAKSHYLQIISEASGYIPNESEKDDPRWKTALTVDVRPGAIQKNAKAFGWKTDFSGKPAIAKTNGKVD